MTIKEVSAYLKIAEEATYPRAETECPRHVVGGTWRSRKQEIDAWIVERMKGGGAND